MATRIVSPVLAWVAADPRGSLSNATVRPRKPGCFPVTSVWS
jgi:hypothetical protein